MQPDAPEQTRHEAPCPGERHECTRVDSAGAPPGSSTPQFSVSDVLLRWVRAAEISATSGSAKPPQAPADGRPRRVYAYD